MYMSNRDAPEQALGWFSLHVHVALGLVNFLIYDVIISRYN